MKEGEIMENKEKWEKIAEMLGLKLNQEFKISDSKINHFNYIITENGLWYKNNSDTIYKSGIPLHDLLFGESITPIIQYQDWFPEFGKIYYCVEITDIGEYTSFPKGIMCCEVKNMGKEEKWLREMKKLRLIFPTVKEAEERYKEIMEKIK